MVKFVFYHSKLRKRPFLLKCSNSCPLFRRPCLCVGKTSCYTIKTWCNFKRINTFLNSQILLNLIHKMKYLTDQFQLCFRVCIGNTIQLYLLLHWHPYSRQLASCCICFVLSLLSDIECSCRMSIQLCYVCVQDVEKL